MNTFNSQFPNFLERVNVYCQKVLPLAFDNSLSYYEFLGKMNLKLNEVIDAINAQNLNIIEFTHMVSLEVQKFEEYMENRQQAFEDKINAEWQEFKTEMLEAWEQMKKDWADFKKLLEDEWALEKLKNEQFRTEIAENMRNFRNEINKIISDFKDEINAEFDAFKIECNTNFENFKNETNEKIDKFEIDMNNDFNGFKDTVNTAINDFKTEIRTNETNFENRIISLFENWAEDEEKHLDEWKNQYFLIWEEWKKGTESYINAELKYLIEKISELGYSEYSKVSGNIETIENKNPIEINLSPVISYKFTDTEALIPNDTATNLQNYEIRSMIIKENVKIFLPFLIDKTVTINSNTIFNINLESLAENSTLMNCYVIPPTAEASFTFDDILQYEINPKHLEPITNQKGNINLSFTTSKELTGKLLFYITSSAGLFEQPTENEEFLTVQKIYVNENSSTGTLTFAETETDTRRIFYPKIKVDDSTIKYNEKNEIYSTGGGGSGNINLLKSGLVANYVEENEKISTVFDTGDIGSYTLDNLSFTYFFSETTLTNCENLISANPTAGIFIDSNNHLQICIKSNSVPVQYGCTWKMYYKIFTIS